MNTATSCPQHPNPHAPVVARFRLTTQERGLPVALRHWRVTTADITVANELHALLGGEAPKRVPGAGRDDVEVLTATTDLRILLDGPTSIRTQYVASDGCVSDGRSVTFPDGTQAPDPIRDLAHRQRHRLSLTDGTRGVTSLHARLADAPHLGGVLFRSTSWALAERWQEAGHPAAAGAGDMSVPAVLSIARRALGGRGPSVSTAELHIGR